MAPSMKWNRHSTSARGSFGSAFAMASMKRWLEASNATDRILRDSASGSVASRARNRPKAGPPIALRADDEGRPHESVEDVFQLRSAIGALFGFVEQPKALLSDRRGAQRKQRFQKAVLGAEVIGDGREIDLRRRADRAQADARHAVLGKQLLGCMEDALARRRRLHCRDLAVARGLCVVALGASPDELGVSHP